MGISIAMKVVSKLSYRGIKAPDREIATINDVALLEGLGDTEPGGDLIKACFVSVDHLSENLLFSSSEVVNINHIHASIKTLNQDGKKDLRDSDSNSFILDRPRTRGFINFFLVLAGSDYDAMKHLFPTALPASGVFAVGEEFSEDVVFGAGPAKRTVMVIDPTKYDAAGGVMETFISGEILKRQQNPASFWMDTTSTVVRLVSRKVNTGVYSDRENKIVYSERPAADANGSMMTTEGYTLETPTI